MKAGFRTSAQTAVLLAVHDHPGLTRTQAAAEIGITSGFAAETVARLVAAELIAERPVPATGRRGRPTTVLGAHPDGPLVAAAAIGQETWQAAAVELGGTVMAGTTRAHNGDQDRVLGAVAAALERIRDRFGARVRAAAVAVPGTVAGSRLLLAPGLSWHEVDLSMLWRHYEPGSEFVVGNDATLGGVAESRRAPGFHSGTMLYLHVADGIGGAVVEAGRAVTGATGAAGEFGHMPFGDPGRLCRCGATGCWNTSIDGPALARSLPGNTAGGGDGCLRHVLASARAGDPGALSAVRAVGTSIGRGVAGLVNGLDPHLVVVGGLGPELLRLVGNEITAAYHGGLMAFRVVPPPIAAARLGADGPLLGAADEAFTKLLTDEGLQGWGARKQAARQTGDGAQPTRGPTHAAPQPPQS